LKNFLLAISLFFCLAGILPRAATLPGKKVLFIVAPQNFRDEELFIPREIITKAGYRVDIASLVLGQLSGMQGKKVVCNLLLSQVELSEYQALVFIDGPGAQVYWDNPEAQFLAQKAVQERLVLGAICIAPVTLARAGVLKGRKATVWPELKGELSKGGAEYLNRGVVKDGNIVTASGPQAAREFGETLLRLLKS